MIIRLAITAVFFSFFTASAAISQGFAGLGTTADGFAEVVPGKKIEFPRDFGAHPDYRIEWWYVTANLKAEDGTILGVQWTLFRQATKPGAAKSNWSSHEFWLGHAAITTTDQHLIAEKLARGGSGQAGARNDRLEAWIDDWRFSAQAGGQGLNLVAHGDGFSYNLQLSERGPKVLHGDAGFSVKSDQGQASYYFSHPFLEAKGSVTINGKTVEVTGAAWLDREWSSQPLASNQKGWDWFSIKFDNGDRLMLFGLRDDAGKNYRSGSWIDTDGTVTKLDGDDIRLTPTAYSDVKGHIVPTSWQVSILSRKTHLTVSALNPDSWMHTSIPYWEGPISVSGSHEAVGYLEMTGY